jgi:hypothetical protein
MSTSLYCRARFVHRPDSPRSLQSSPVLPAETPIPSSSCILSPVLHINADARLKLIGIAYSRAQQSVVFVKVFQPKSLCHRRAGVGVGVGVGEIDASHLAALSVSMTDLPTYNLSDSPAVFFTPHTLTSPCSRRIASFSLSLASPVALPVLAFD